MYIERKCRGDSFWVMRLSDEDKEMHIKNISYAINECVKEEYREEFYKAIIRIFKKAEHNEKYDADNGQSVIISSSQISSLLLYLFHLLWLTADCKRDSEETIRVQAELIDGYKKLADEQEKYIDKYADEFAEKFAEAFVNAYEAEESAYKADIESTD